MDFADCRGNTYCIDFIAFFSSAVQIMVGSNSQSNPGTVYQLSDILIVGHILASIFAQHVFFNITREKDFLCLKLYIFTQSIWRINHGLTQVVMFKLLFNLLK